MKKEIIVNVLSAIALMIFITWQIGDSTLFLSNNAYKLGPLDMPLICLDYSSDSDGITELQNTLLSSNYGRDWEKGVFDCTQMSLACAKWLEKKGYKTMIMVNVQAAHVWVVVKVGDGYVPVDTTISPRESMGYVLQNRDWLCGRVYKSADLFETEVNINNRLMSELQNGNVGYSATGWTA
jgi:hypothetical protein